VIAEAIDTLITLGWAALAWLTVLAAVTAIVLLAGTAVGAWAVRAVWRTARPTWARGRHHAQRIARRTRPDYEEAA
jgi:multisubunit Na+/H+ antiporter MnhE subunit